MVSCQGFICPLLDCVTRGHCYVLYLANPLEAGGTLFPALWASHLLDFAGTPPPIHRTDPNTKQPSTLSSFWKVFLVVAFEVHAFGAQWEGCILGSTPTSTASQGPDGWQAPGSVSHW